VRRPSPPRPGRRPPAAAVPAVSGLEASPSSTLPVVAIVGRPNVGKSTLFNRILGQRRAIVDDRPGVTRDRLVAAAEHRGRRFLCVDTGGFEAQRPREPESLVGQVRAQALAAVNEAVAIVCVVDGTAGPRPADQETIRFLARSGKPLFVAVNKIDSPARDVLVHEFWTSGVSQLWPISAAHGRGVAALLDAIVDVLPAAGDEALPGDGTRIALLGRPNVGKSSLLNRLLGTDRALVTPEPGTTRDAVDTPITVGQRRYLLVDTAGIRKWGRIVDPIERHGAVRALGALARSELVLLVLDAVDGMTDQDARLVGRVLEAGKAIALLANKWDAVPAARRDRQRFARDIAAQYPAFASIPLLCVSARTGEGLEALPETIARMENAYRAKLPTSVLNRVLREAVEASAPPSPEGRSLRFFYATQTASGPPTVTVFTNAPARVPRSYRRYLATRIAEAFGLRTVPLRLVFRGRRP